MGPSIGFSGRQGLSPEDLVRYRSYVPGVDDVIWQPTYDYQTYPNLGQSVFTFFQVARGSGTTSAPGGAGPKTALDTNMQLSGQFGAGNQMLVMGIELQFWAGSLPGLALTAVPTEAQTARNWDDVYTVARNGVLTFEIQNRPYLEDGPIEKFPSQTNLTGVATNASVNTNATIVNYQQIEYASTTGLSYNIVPVLIRENQAFVVRVTFPGLVALPSTVDGRFGCRLNGKLIRNAQ